jgi:hypothetical protein
VERVTADGVAVALPPAWERADAPPLDAIGTCRPAVVALHPEDGCVLLVGTETAPAGDDSGTYTDRQLAALRDRGVALEVIDDVAHPVAGVTGRRLTLAGGVRHRHVTVEALFAVAPGGRALACTATVPTERYGARLDDVDAIIASLALV